MLLWRHGHSLISASIMTDDLLLFDNEVVFLLVRGTLSPSPVWQVSFTPHLRPRSLTHSLTRANIKKVRYSNIDLISQREEPRPQTDRQARQVDRDRPNKTVDESQQHQHETHNVPHPWHTHISPLLPASLTNRPYILYGLLARPCRISNTHTHHAQRKDKEKGKLTWPLVHSRT